MIPESELLSASNTPARRRAIRRAKRLTGLTSALGARAHYTGPCGGVVAHPPGWYRALRAHYGVTS